MSKPGLGPDSIRADAVTGGCIRTADDTLSVWSCFSDKKHIEEVVLALALGPKIDHLEAMDVVLLSRSILETQGLTLEITPGDTLVEDLRGRHVNLVNLDMNKICFLAVQIAANLRQNDSCYRFTKGEILALACAAVKAERVSLNRLNDRMRAEVEQRL